MRETRIAPATRARTRSPLKPQLRIGISGWRYAGWRGKFYPPGLAQRRELEYASRVFNSIEINGSFYSLQLPSSYQRWYTETPKDFLFSVKGARYITHMKRLRDARASLANFFASGVLALVGTARCAVCELSYRITQSFADAAARHPYHFR